MMSFLVPIYQKRGTNSMKTTNKVAIYVRVSTTSQVEEGYSIDEQKLSSLATAILKTGIYTRYILMVGFLGQILTGQH